MGRALNLEPFGRAAEREKAAKAAAEVAAKTAAEAAAKAAAIRPEDTELYRLGHAAGHAEGYAAGAATVAAEQKTLLALAAEAVKRATADRRGLERAATLESVDLALAAMRALAPRVIEAGFIDQAVAELKCWIGGAAEGAGVLLTACETRDALAAALAEHPDLATLDIQEDSSLAPFALRFEWRAGVAEFDASAAAAAVMAILQGHADAAIAAPLPEPSSDPETGSGTGGNPDSSSVAPAPTAEPEPIRKPSPLEQFDLPEGAAPNPLARS